MVSLQGKLWVPKKQLVPTQRALVEHIALTQAEPGCQAFEVRQSTDDPLCFDVNERFDDDEAFMIHQQRVADSPWGALTKGFPRHYKVTGQFKGADVSHMQRALVLADAAAAAERYAVSAGSSNCCLLGSCLELGKPPWLMALAVFSFIACDFVLKHCGEGGFQKLARAPNGLTSKMSRGNNVSAPTKAMNMANPVNNPK